MDGREDVWMEGRMCGWKGVCVDGVEEKEGCVWMEGRGDMEGGRWEECVLCDDC